MEEDTKDMVRVMGATYYIHGVLLHTVDMTLPCMFLEGNLFFLYPNKKSDFLNEKVSLFLHVQEHSNSRELTRQLKERVTLQWTM
jgi:hypothetical protein